MVQQQKPLRGSFCEIVYFRAFKEAAITTQIKGKFIEIKPRQSQHRVCQRVK